MGKVLLPGTPSGTILATLLVCEHLFSRDFTRRPFSGQFGCLWACFSWDTFKEHFGAFSCLWPRFSRDFSRGPFRAFTCLWVLFSVLHFVRGICGFILCSHFADLFVALIVWPRVGLLSCFVASILRSHFKNLFVALIVWPWVGVLSCFVASILRSHFADLSCGLDCVASSWNLVLFVASILWSRFARALVRPLNTNGYFTQAGRFYIKVRLCPWIAKGSFPERKGLIV